MSYTGSPDTVAAPGAQPSVARGIAAGVAAAVAGAALWALITGFTNRRFAIVAMGVGYLVGYAIARFGRTSGPMTMATAAIIAFTGVLAGHVASVYVAVVRSDGAQARGIGLSEVMERLGPLDVLTDSTLTGPIAWLFFLVAPFFAARISVAADDQPAPAGAASYPPPTAPAISYPPAAPDAAYGAPTGTPDAQPGAGVTGRGTAPDAP